MENKRIIKKFFEEYNSKNDVYSVSKSETSLGEGVMSLEDHMTDMLGLLINELLQLEKGSLQG